MATNLEKRLERLEHARQPGGELLFICWEKSGDAISKAQFGEQSICRGEGESGEDFSERVSATLAGKSGVVWME